MAMYDDDATIGARLRVLRRWRGLTLAELAGHADLSPSFLSMCERGQRMLDRRSHIAAVASALGVSETELTGGPHLTPDPLQSDPHRTVPPLRVALETNTLDEPARDRARPLHDLAAEMSRVEHLRRGVCDYVEIGAVLPELLDELHVHVADPEDEAAHRRALEVLVDGCVAASATTRNLGYADLAYLAALRAAETAAVLDDPIQSGKASFMRVLTMPRAGSWDRVLDVAERGANSLEPHARDPLGIQVLGMVTLTAALSAAALYRGEVAAQWLDEADRLADALDDDPAGNWESFSRTNVGIWRVTVGVERGESGGAVLELARRVDVAKLERKASRRASFLCDVGRGLAREPRTRGQAVRWLRQAEATAPQRIRNSVPARETVAYLLGRAAAAAGGRELRGMAARMGVPH